MSATLNQPLIELYACCVSNNNITPKEIRLHAKLQRIVHCPFPPMYSARNNLEWVTHIQLLGVDIDDKQAGPFKLRD